MKPLLRRILALLTAFALCACSDNDDVVQDATLPENVLLFNTQQLANVFIAEAIAAGEIDPQARLSGEIEGTPITIVKLSGKTNHFGRDLAGQYLDYEATVPDTKIWMPEYPETRDLNLGTDETGWWTLYVVKDTGTDLEMSFIYEKEGWITTRSNVLTIGDEDDLDMAIQYIDPDFFNVIMLPFVEAMMRGNGYPNFFFRNAMVVTVGKSWSSMHNDALPHGDPGATVTIQPAAENYIGPVYFNEDVVPDVNQADVSVDGGVTWLNMPTDATYQVSAEKPGVNYDTVKFRIDAVDEEYGVQLYIASPPDSVEGDNDSGPGEY